MAIYLTQRPPRFVRNLPAEARARRLRRQNQPRRDAGILQSPRRYGNSTVFSARVARSGPMTYLDSVGRAHVETRDENELRRIIGQLPGKPVVVGHPDDGMMGDGSKHPVVGRVVSAWFEAGDPAHAVADIQIDDPTAAQAITDGSAKEVSLGYLCDLDGPRQQRTEVDHVALVANGRCGASCSVRTDARVAHACACGCGSCSTTGRKDNVQNPNYSPDPDPQDLAHKSLSGANAAPYSWTPIPADADRQDIQTRLLTFGAARFASGADREAARADLLAAARRVGLDALARMYQVQWSTGEIADDPDKDLAAAEERARSRAADAYIGTGDVR